MQDDETRTAPVAPLLSGHAVRARFACERGAIFDPDQPDVYRYVLSRCWAAGPPLAAQRLVNFVMLNPSAADASRDDPTIVRCMHYARRWGYDGLIITNLYGLRSTDARALRHHPDAVGPANDRHIVEQASFARLVVCAWGVGRDARGTVNGRYPEGRGAYVERLLRQVRGPRAPLHVLRLGKGGGPAHPLYLPGALTPQVWRERDGVRPAAVAHF